MWRKIVVFHCKMPPDYLSYSGFWFYTKLQHESLHGAFQFTSYGATCFSIFAASAYMESLAKIPYMWYATKKMEHINVRVWFHMCDCNKTVHSIIHIMIHANLTVESWILQARENRSDVQKLMDICSYGSTQIVYYTVTYAFSIPHI